jgi:HlyD family secretion protein
VVKKGQICAIVEVADLELNLSVAQKALHASQEYLRHEEASLLTSQAILEQTRTKTSSRARQLKLQIDATRTRLASEKNKVKLLERAREDARRKAEESQIIAPIDGIVLTKDLQIGEMVSPNSLKPIFVFTSQP